MSSVGSRYTKDFNIQTTKEELIEVYKSYSVGYDEEIMGINYTGHETTAKILEKHAASLNMCKDIRILDAGAGTGLVGEWLNKLGFTKLDALDASPHMIEKAKVKTSNGESIYNKFYCAFLGEELGIEPNSYDALICAGTFTQDHAKGNAMPGIQSIVKPGGLIVFTVRNSVLADPDYEFHKYMGMLTDEKKWKLLAMTEEHYILNITCTVYVYQVL